MNLSLNFAIRSSWSEPQSAPSLVFVHCIELLIFGCKEYNQSDFSIDHLVMSSCRVVSCIALKTVFAITSVFSGQNSVILCLASFCTSRPNLSVTPGISWLPNLHSSPLKGKRHLFWMLVLESLVDLHRIMHRELLYHYLLGHRLGLLWYWMFCLGNEQRSFCRFGGPNNS